VHHQQHHKHVTVSDVPARKTKTDNVQRRNRKDFWMFKKSSIDVGFYLDFEGKY